MQQPLRRRLAQTDFTTRFVILDGDSKMIAVQAAKEGRTPAQIRDKLQATLSVIASMADEFGAKDRVELWAHDLFNPYTLWLDPEFATVALYNLAPGMADTIAFCYSNAPTDGESVYEQLAADVRALLSTRSRRLYPAPAATSSDTSLEVRDSRA
jgi:hypothetical protein